MLTTNLFINHSRESTGESPVYNKLCLCLAPLPVINFDYYAKQDKAAIAER